MIINDLDGYYIVFDTKNWNTELDTLTNKTENMEVVTMEKKAFDLMMARYDALVKKVELLKHKANGKRLNKWLTGHEVCQQLRISQRTLQKLRDRRFLGHTQIGRQFYYCPEEVKAIVPLIDRIKSV